MNRWVFLVATLASAPTFSQSEVGPAELTLFAGNGFGGTFQTESGADVRLDDDSSFGLIFDYEYDTNTQWEVIYLEQTTAADTSALFPTRPSIETDIKYLQGGGTYRGSGDGPRPYLAGTLGITRIDPSGESTRSDTFWSLSIGGGVQFRASERLGFRLEGRVFGTFIDSESALYCSSGFGQNQCLFVLDGDMLWQTHVFAGVTFRF
jgi:hypothetical protein